MNNWKKCKLGDIAEVVGGGTPSTKVDEYWNGDIAWITPKDLTSYNKVFISKGARSITKLGLSQSSAKLMPKGTVLLTSRAPIGYIAIAENEISTNQGFKSLIPKENLTTSKFLYYWLKNNVEYLKNLSVGTTFAEISGQIVKEVEILLPPLEEQRQIATILSSIDDKIELLHEQNKTLEELAQTLFRHYFIENPNPSWQNVKIKKLVNITSGKSLKRLDMQDDGENPILGANGIIGFTNKYLYNEPLLYTGRVGTLGKVFMINSAKKVWLSDNTLIINPSSNFYFMYFILKTSSLENLDVGSTQPLIRQSDLGEIEISLADDLLLEQFDIAAKKIFDKIDKNLEQIQTLENMRDILIPKLLNGEIKINN
ncbi:TPA: restriction endonuclease subunit S [Campylobacter coli]|nr:restriction endonuclease subunit S [Campylobacter coli]